MHRKKPFLHFIHHMLPITSISMQQLEDLFRIRKNRAQLLKVLGEIGVRIHGGSLDFHQIQKSQSLKEFSESLSSIPKIRIELQIKDEKLIYLGVTNSKLKDWNHELAKLRLENQTQENSFLDPQTLPNLFVDFFKIENDTKLKTFYKDAIETLIEIEPSNLIIHAFQFEMCEALFRNERFTYKSLIDIHPALYRYIKNIQESKIQFYQNIKNERLLTYFESYSDVMQLVNAANDSEFKNIDNKEIQHLLNQKIEVYRIKYDTETEIFPIEIEEFYLYLPHSPNESCYVSSMVDNQHRFFKFEDSECIRRFITNYGNLFKREKNEYPSNPFTWEQIRPCNASKDDVMDSAVWSNQLTNMYDKKVEDLYSNIIRPRIFTSFKNIILTVVPKTKIKIFEVGAGNGEIGIQCAEYAAESGYETILFPSDIHLENVKKLEKYKSKTPFQIKAGEASADSLDRYLSDIQSSSENNVVSILISCGCLCFNIIPGDVSSDLRLIQKMHRYQIDWIIADGLEIPIINTRIARNFYREKAIENFYAPKGKHTGFHICLQKVEFENISDNVIGRKLDLSFHPNPVPALFEAMAKREISLKWNILDLRYAYLDQKDKEKLLIIFQNLIEKYPKIKIWLDETKIEFFNSSSIFNKIKLNFIFKPNFTEDLFSMMTGDSLSDYRETNFKKKERRDFFSSNPNMLHFYSVDELQDNTNEKKLNQWYDAPCYFFRTEKNTQHHFKQSYAGLRLIEAIEFNRSIDNSIEIAIHAIDGKYTASARAEQIAESIISNSSFIPFVIIESPNKVFVIVRIGNESSPIKQIEIEKLFKTLEKIEYKNCFKELKEIIISILFPPSLRPPY